jgi:hypothetical protein
MRQAQERDSRDESETVAPEDVNDDVLAGDVGEDVLASGHVHDLGIDDVAQQGPENGVKI